jgi:hypothetical protein
LLLAAITLAGCKDDDPGAPRDITVQDNASLTQDVFADEQQGKSEVTFTAAGAWASSIAEAPATKATAPAWVSIAPDHGDEAGDYTIAISLATNYSGEDRAATITLVCNISSITINVAQKGVTANGIVPSAACDILTFSVDGVEWTIDGEEITCVYPSETVMTPLSPVITLSPGATVDPPASEERDLFSPAGVTYTVTGEDGVTTRTYTARATITPLYSGTSGDCTWAITGPAGNYTLAISGDGAMANHDNPILPLLGREVAPWYQYRENLKTAIVHDGVTMIGEYAFHSCASLASVTIGRSVVTIFPSAFYYCAGLTAFRVDAANTRFSADDGVLFNEDKTMLYCCPAGTTGDFVVSGTVTEIANAAFYECRGLTSVTIPGSVTEIGPYAFEGCRGLTTMTIPDQVQAINEGTFWGCRGLTAVTIPESVQTIGNDAFWSCTDLASVTIPGSVQTIGEGAFWRCTGLTTVTSLNPVPPVTGDRAVDDDLAAATLRVPAAAVNDYQNAPGWGAFGSVVAR